jgi:hypothetical protein
VTVAATALALTMGSAAVAYAEPAPLPPIPSPGDVLSTVPQTLTPASTSPVSQSAVSQSPVSQSPVSQSPVSQSPVSQSPATPTTPGQAPATVARGAARPVSHLVVPSRARAARPAYVARATSARIRAAVPTYAVPPYAVPAALRLPPATELATSTAAQPTIAPLVVRPTGHAVTAGATRRSPAVDDGSLRALVVALALGAAAAVASGHLGRVRRSMR